MKNTGNIFANNYWLMKFAPLALFLAAVVIFFCNLYAHIWNGAIIYLPLLFLGLYGNSPVKTVCGLLLVLLLINLVFLLKIHKKIFKKWLKNEKL